MPESQTSSLFAAARPRLDTAQGSSDRHLQNVSLPGVNAASLAALSFRVNPNADVTLQVRISNTVAVRQAFNTEPQRSWHTIVASNTLRSNGNELIVGVSSEGDGSVQISGIVLLYQADINWDDDQVVFER